MRDGWYALNLWNTFRKLPESGDEMPQVPLLRVGIATTSAHCRDHVTRGG
jgi:hypothetical protein